MALSLYGKGVSGGFGVDGGGGGVRGERRTELDGRAACWGRVLGARLRSNQERGGSQDGEREDGGWY